MPIDFLLSDGMRPFTTAYLAVAGLLLLEVVLMAIGLSSALDGTDTGVDVDAADLDADLDAEIDVAHGGALPEHGFAEMLDGATDADIDHPDAIHAPDLSGRNTDGRHISFRKPGTLGWLGLRDVPLTVWLATLATTFGTAGYLLQWMVSGLAGHLLPAIVATALAFLPALLVTRRLSRTIGRLVPRIETAAISERSYGRRVGVVTTGVARRGYPAEVRFTDGYGTQHYTLAEPLDAADEIPAGAEVALMKLRTGELRIVRIDA